MIENEDYDESDTVEKSSNSMDATSLTDWENPPTVADLKKDYEESAPTRDAHVNDVNAWLDNLNVKGKARPKKVSGRSNFVPRLIRKQAEWRYAALSEPFLSTREIFKASPVTWEDTEAARQNQLVLNSQFNAKIPKVKLIDNYVRAAVDEGTVVAKVTWDFEEEEVEEEENIYEFFENPQLAELHQQIAQLKQENPAGYETEVPEELQKAHEATVESGIPVEAELVGTEMVIKTITTKNQPQIDICDYRTITIDPTCEGDMAECQFVIHEFNTSLSQLKKDGRYKNLDKITASSVDILGAPDEAVESGSVFEFSDKPRKQFTVYEYWGFWDINKTGTVEPIVAAWVGNTLIRLEENPYPHKMIPFVVVPYLPERRSAYGKPDGALLEDNQKIAGAVTRGMIDLLGRSANGQTGMRKDMLDVVNRRKYDRGEDYEFNPTADPRQGVHTHVYPEIPASAHNMLNMTNMDAESLSGVKAYSGGLSGDALGESVGNGRSVLDAASKREMGILRRLAGGLVEMGRLIIAMNSEFLDEEEIVRITNDQFVPVRRDDLAGKIDLELTISTAEEDHAKSQDLAFVLQTNGINMDEGMRNKIMAEIVRLKKMPDFAKQLEEYEPQPDPMQQEMQQLELAKLKAEIAEIESRTAENYAEAELDKAKASASQADADKKTLDFVEQESGVTQERNKELQGEQAESNMKLETHKATLGNQQKTLDGIRNYMTEKK